MRLILINIGIIIFLSLNNVSFAQKAIDSNLKRQIDINYKKLFKKDFEEREQAVSFFCGLKAENISKEVLDAVAEILQEEKNKGVFRVEKSAKPSPNADESIGERYGGYIEGLCEIIGSSRDGRRLPLLIENCLEPKVLINFGDAAVTPLVDVILKPVSMRDKRLSSIIILGEMLKPKKEDYVAKGEVRAKIKKVLIQTALDEDASIRQLSVRALGNSEDEDVIPILENIAKNDPLLVRKKDEKGNIIEEYYLIREEAQKALIKIKERMTTVK